MAVPQKIREVKRPINTIVEDSGKDTLKRYAVKERKNEVYRKGKKGGSPRNGRVIGWIINNKYVAKKVESKINVPDGLSFGGVEVVKNLSKDIYDDLLTSFDVVPAITVYVLALLKVLKPDTRSSRIAQLYKKTYLSIYFPGLGLSANSISAFKLQLGENSISRNNFFRLRLKAVEKEHHIIIDGTLVQNTSTVNDLSGYSFKSRMKGVKQVSVIYAYDLEKKEPICSQVFPGNMIDQSTFAKFVDGNNINRGVLIADKGFPIKSVKSLLKANSELHFVSPLKRNDLRIKNNKMYEWVAPLPNTNKHVMYKKQKIDGGNFLYSFIDLEQAYYESTGYLENKFSKEGYDKKKEQFGTIVFISDLDLSPEKVYDMYMDRWEIETSFKMYKHNTDMNATRVQQDFSVIGEYFINFVASLITSRLSNICKEKKIYEIYSFKEVIEDLNSIWRKVKLIQEQKGLELVESLGAVSEPDRNDEYWVNCFEYALDLLEMFNVIEDTGNNDLEKQIAKKIKTRTKDNDELKGKGKKKR